MARRTTTGKGDSEPNLPGCCDRWVAVANPSWQPGSANPLHCGRATGISCIASAACDHLHPMPTSLGHLTTDELQRHGAAMRALGRSLLGGDADDLLQDGWVAALQAPPPRHLRGWLAGTLRRLAASRRRSDWRRQQHERQAARPEALPSAAETAAAAEVARRLAVAVEQLHEPYRTAVVLRFWHGLAPAQLGARLGVPPNTARSRVQRGIELLRSGLTRDCGSQTAWAAPLAAMLQVANGAGQVSSAAASLLTLIFAMKTKLLLGTSALALLALVASTWLLVPPEPAHSREAPASPAPVAATAAAAPPPSTTAQDTSIERKAAPEAGRTEVRVHVVDEHEQPMPDMPVAAFDRRQQTGSASTDADGMALLLLPPGEHWVQADAVSQKRRPDLHAGGATVDAKGEPTDLRLVMERYSCAVRVLVVDDLSAPLEGVRIRRMTNTGGQSPASVTTDANGCALFTGLPPTPLEFDIEQDSLKHLPVAVLANSRQRCTVARDGLTSIEYHLARMAKVLFAVNGVKGVDVEFWPRMRDQNPWAYREASCRTRNGVLTLSLPPGTYEIASPIVDADKSAVCRRTATFDCVPGEQKLVEISLEPAPGIVSLTVLDEHGLPVEAASVCARARFPEPMWTKWVSRSTAQGGHYVLRGIPEGPLDLFIDARGVHERKLAFFGGTDEMPWLQLDGHVTDLAVVLHDAYAIHGTVLDTNGKPITDGQVSRGRAGGLPSDRATIGRDRRGFPTAPGTFDFQWLRPGNYPLWIGSSEEGPPDAVVEVGPDVTPSKVAEVVLRQRPTTKEK